MIHLPIDYHLMVQNCISTTPPLNRGIGYEWDTQGVKINIYNAELDQMSEFSVYELYKWLGIQPNHLKDLICVYNYISNNLFDLIPQYTDYQTWYFDEQVLTIIINESKTVYVSANDIAHSMQRHPLNWDYTTLESVFERNNSR
ncbi:hypothetical protein [Photobacterium leiognathi]|uniref:hypothetical protein n=1 Tax=Photobacterium leiognathi TaxID=553611 RepID=UPI0029823F37|nr:hypothetical protein [Photobacterium leiognathi]